MQNPSTFPITRTFPGRLSTMAHPPGDPDLATALTHLRSQGTDILVSALTPPEQISLNLTTEPAAARTAGIEFHSLPIPDFGTPDRTEITPTLTHLLDRLRGGANVVIHCWGGIGRSSLLAASLLVQDGVEPDEAWRLISEARGVEVPETDEQRNWIRFT